MILLIPLLQFCTENPFFEDDVEISQNLKIEGTVLLSDQFSPENVYVWLSDIDIATTTNDKGSYSLELPDPASQPGGGLSGVFTLYFYLANYALDSASVLILNGQFEYGKGDINTRGVVNKTVLPKLLDIKSVLSPAKVFDFEKNTIEISFILTSRTDSVTVQTYKNPGGQTSCLAIQVVGAETGEGAMIRGNYTTLMYEVIKDETEWYMAYVFSPHYFKPGKYAFRPFLRIMQPGLPRELIRSIDAHAYDFDLGYLKLPFKIQGGILNVSD